MTTACPSMNARARRPARRRKRTPSVPLPPPLPDRPTHIARRHARRLEETSDTRRIWAEDLLGPDPTAPPTCYCCGQTRWWTKSSGQAVCQTCHPDPRAGRDAAKPST